MSIGMKHVGYRLQFFHRFSWIMGLGYSEVLFVLFFSCQDYCAQSKSVCSKSKHILEAAGSDGQEHWVHFYSVCPKSLLRPHRWPFLGCFHRTLRCSFIPVMHLFLGASQEQQGLQEGSHYATFWTPNLNKTQYYWFNVQLMASCMKRIGKGAMRGF